MWSNKFPIISPEYRVRLKMAALMLSIVGVPVVIGLSVSALTKKTKAPPVCQVEETTQYACQVRSAKLFAKAMDLPEVDNISCWAGGKDHVYCDYPETRYRKIHRFACNCEACSFEGGQTRTY